VLAVVAVKSAKAVGLKAGSMQLLRCQFTESRPICTENCTNLSLKKFLIFGTDIQNVKVVIKNKKSSAGKSKELNVGNNNLIFNN